MSDEEIRLYLKDCETLQAQLVLVGWNESDSVDKESLDRLTRERIRENNRKLQPSNSGAAAMENHMSAMADIDEDGAIAPTPPEPLAREDLERSQARALEPQLVKAKELLYEPIHEDEKPVDRGEAKHADASSKLVIINSDAKRTLCLNLIKVFPNTKDRERFLKICKPELWDSLIKLFEIRDITATETSSLVQEKLKSINKDNQAEMIRFIEITCDKTIPIATLSDAKETQKLIKLQKSIPPAMQTFFHRCCSEDLLSSEEVIALDALTQDEQEILILYMQQQQKQRKELEPVARLKESFLATHRLLKTNLGWKYNNLTPEIQLLFIEICRKAPTKGLPLIMAFASATNPESDKLDEFLKVAHISPDDIEQDAIQMMLFSCMGSIANAITHLKEKSITPTLLKEKYEALSPLLLYVEPEWIDFLKSSYDERSVVIDRVPDVISAEELRNVWRTCETGADKIVRLKQYLAIRQPDEKNEHRTVWQRFVFNEFNEKYPGFMDEAAPDAAIKKVFLQATDIMSVCCEKNIDVNKVITEFKTFLNGDVPMLEAFYIFWWSRDNSPSDTERAHLFANPEALTLSLRDHIEKLRALNASTDFEIKYEDEQFKVRTSPSHFNQLNASLDFLSRKEESVLVKYLNALEKNALPTIDELQKKIREDIAEHDASGSATNPIDEHAKHAALEKTKQDIQKHIKNIELEYIASVKSNATYDSKQKYHAGRQLVTDCIKTRVIRQHRRLLKSIPRGLIGVLIMLTGIGTIIAAVTWEAYKDTFFNTRSVARLHGTRRELDKSIAPRPGS